MEKKQIQRQWCVMFKNGKGFTLRGKSKEHIREKHEKENDGVKSVFTMGIKHSKGDK